MSAPDVRDLDWVVELLSLLEGHAFDPEAVHVETAPGTRVPAYVLVDETHRARARRVYDHWSALYQADPLSARILALGALYPGEVGRIRIAVQLLGQAPLGPKPMVPKAKPKTGPGSKLASHSLASLQRALAAKRAQWEAGKETLVKLGSKAWGRAHTAWREVV